MAFDSHRASPPSARLQHLSATSLPYARLISSNPSLAGQEHSAGRSSRPCSSRTRAVARLVSASVVRRGVPSAQCSSAMASASRRSFRRDAGRRRLMRSCEVVRHRRLYLHGARRAPRHRRHRLDGTVGSTGTCGSTGTGGSTARDRRRLAPCGDSRRRRRRLAATYSGAETSGRETNGSATRRLDGRPSGRRPLRGRPAARRPAARRPAARIIGSGDKRSEINPSARPRRGMSCSAPPAGGDDRLCADQLRERGVSATALRGDRRLGEEQRHPAGRVVTGDASVPSAAGRTAQASTTSPHSP